MAWFEISPYFTFRWVDNNIVSPYNTLPLESEQDALSYAQPIQCGGGGYQVDIGLIQLTSDFVPTGGLYDYHTNALIKVIDFVPIDPPILGVSFICYNAEIDFSDVNPGKYYAKINWTDDTAVVHDWRTSPLDVQIFHEGTQLFECTHFSNDKGIVFINPDKTTLVIPHRVASLIQAPLVKTDASDYEDQYSELTQEVSVPFVIYTQIIGGPTLLPFWVIEKINLLYSLDQVLIDGNPFTKVSSSDFKPTRSDTMPQGAWWEVDIQPNFSYPIQQFITGTPTDGGDYIVIKQAKTFKAQSANFSFAGVFTAGVNLVRVAIVNNGLEAVTVLVGIAEGDASLGTLKLNADQTDSVDIGKLFKVPTTVWISGIAGANLDITFDWNNYLAVNTPPAPSGGSGFKKNTLYYFDEIEPGSFEVEFDVATGMGNVGTDHEGCVLAGTNGTPERAGLVVQIWNSAEVLPANTRGTIDGAENNQITLTEDQLPEHTHLIANEDTTNNALDAGANNILARSMNAGIKRDYNLSGSSTAQSIGLTSAVGVSDPIDITNRAVILPAFYYIGS